MFPQSLSCTMPVQSTRRFLVPSDHTASWQTRLATHKFCFVSAQPSKDLPIQLYYWYYWNALFSTTCDFKHSPASDLFLLVSKSRYQYVYSFTCQRNTIASKLALVDSQTTFSTSFLRFHSSATVTSLQRTTKFWYYFVGGHLSVLPASSFRLRLLLGLCSKATTMNSVPSLTVAFSFAFSSANVPPIHTMRTIVSPRYVLLTIVARVWTVHDREVLMSLQVFILRIRQRLRSEYSSRNLTARATLSDSLSSRWERNRKKRSLASSCVLVTSGEQSNRWVSWGPDVLYFLSPYFMHCHAKTLVSILLSKQKTLAVCGVQVISSQVRIN